MIIPKINSRDLPNSWRILEDIGNFRERGLTFRFPYLGAFSQALAEWFIRVYSNPDDIILDVFSGRGTVAMQALWYDRHVICNDLSPYSNTLCHSVLWTPSMKDVFNFLEILEEDILKENYKIDINYLGKSTPKDVAKLYHPDTFDQIVRLMNLLNSHNMLFGKDSRAFAESNDFTYNHEIVMFVRMVMSQCMLHSSADLAFNGLKIRSSDNTTIKSILRYYQKNGERPKKVNIFDIMRSYIEKMDLDGIGIRNRFSKLHRNMISCDARKLDLPDNCIDMVLTSPPYYGNINYGMANWLRIWSISGLGDPLVGNHINIENLGIQNNSEMHGKMYDKITDKGGGTVNNPASYSAFTGQYLKELDRVLTEDSVAIIVVGDYGNKRKVEAWRTITDIAEILGFKPQMVIMDELNKQTKSSTQLQSRFDGGRNDYDVCVVLTKGKYQIKNDPKNVNFRWGARFYDNRQMGIEDTWGVCV